MKCDLLHLLKLNIIDLSKICKQKLNQYNSHSILFKLLNNKTLLFVFQVVIKYLFCVI